MTQFGVGPVRSPRWRYPALTVAVPINTPIATPTSTSWALGDVYLQTVHVRVPRGHAGLTGIAIQDAGLYIIPTSTAATWVIADGSELDFDVEMEVSPPLVVLAYNTDTIYTHTFYLRAKVRDFDLFRRGASPASVPVF